MDHARTPQPSRQQRRGEIEDYFDRTAMQAWEQLTSDRAGGPHPRHRARRARPHARHAAGLAAGRPARPACAGRRLRHRRAGDGSRAPRCHVVAIDLSPTLVELARERVAQTPADVPMQRRHIDFRSGDCTDPALGEFDHVVAMDSLIHYNAADAVRVLAGLAGAHPRLSMVFTFAPSNPAAGA
jgi:magnesium-protoporphyrin O-methyltransferase